MSPSRRLALACLFGVCVSASASTQGRAGQYATMVSGIIETLSGAATAPLYGQRAAIGAVIIDTRRLHF